MTNEEDMRSDDVCERCGCCSQEWVECYNCDDDGMTDHDCGEDSCCCLEPWNNVQCDICNGKTGWYACLGRCVGGKHETVPSSS